MPASIGGDESDEIHSHAVTEGDKDVVVVGVVVVVDGASRVR